MKNKKTMRAELAEEENQTLGQEVIIKETSLAEWETLSSNLRMNLILIQIIQWCKLENH